jgi:hypothetical protein
MGAHGLIAAYHHRLVEVGIDNFALVERQFDPLPIRLIVLIGVGNAVHGNGCCVQVDVEADYPCAWWITSPLGTTRGRYDEYSS